MFIIHLCWCDFYVYSMPGLGIAKCPIEGPCEICTQSDEVRLAVSGAQPLFTLGLLMFVLSLVDFLSLLLSPSTDIKIFLFFQKYHLKDTYKIFKKCHFFLNFNGVMLLTTQWLLKRAARLTSLVWVCVVWRPESLMDISALWWQPFGVGKILACA